MSGWATVPLGTALELAYGKALPKSMRAEGGTVPVYGSNGIAGWHGEAIVTGPTVIVGRKGSAGAVQYVDGPCYPIDTTYFVRLRPGFEFDMKFLFYLLRKLDLSRLRTATGVPGLTREDAYRESIPVPPLNEQRRIVDLLTRAEGIVRLRREAQKKAQAIIPALFVDMFGNPATNPKGWDTAQLGNIARMVGGSSLPVGEPFSGQQDGLLLLKVGDMNLPGNEVFIRSSKEWVPDQRRTYSTVQPDTIVLPKRGAAIATNKKRVTTRPALLDPNLMGVQGDVQVIRPIFLYQWFCAFDLADITSGTTVPQLNKGDLAPLTVYIPPLKQQLLFEQHMEGFFSLSTQQTAAMDRAEATFNALLARVFSVRGQQAASLPKEAAVA